MIYIIGSRGIPARYGGFETLAQRLHDGLTQQGVDVSVIGTRDESARRSLVGKLVRLNAFRALETPLLTWTTRPRVGNSDTVLVVNPINIWTAKWLARTGARVWLHMDGLEHERRKWGRTARFAHRFARRSAARSRIGLVVDSHAIAESLRTEFGVETVCIGYGGCPEAELDVEHRWQPTGLSNTFLVVARPEPENNILEICRAFIASGIVADLMVVGAPEKSTRYWDAVNAAVAAAPNIHLVPGIWNRNDLCALYRTCRAVIHGHSAGGTNPALVDALSHGTPTFAHDNPFNRETAGKAATFWTDETHLATLLAQLMNKEPETSVWEKNSLLNWGHVIDAYRQLLARG